MTGQVVSLTPKHGAYKANSDSVSVFASYFFGSMDGTFRLLLKFLMDSVGHGNFDYWADLTMLDAIIIVCSDEGGNRDWNEYIRFIDKQLD